MILFLTNSILSLLISISICVSTPIPLSFYSDGHDAWIYPFPSPFLYVIKPLYENNFLFDRDGPHLSDSAHAHALPTNLYGLSALDLITLLCNFS